MRRLSSRLSRRSDEGAAAVEFALVSILLFLLIFGLVEFGLGYFTEQGAAAAAREAARRAAVGQLTSCNSTTLPPENSDPSGLRLHDFDAVVDDTAGGAAGYLYVTTSSPDGKTSTLQTFDTNGDGVIDSGDTVKVTIRYHVDLPFVSSLIPGLPNGFTNLSQTGTARVENQKSGSVTSC